MLTCPLLILAENGKIHPLTLVINMRDTNAAKSTVYKSTLTKSTIRCRILVNISISNEMKSHPE